MHPFAPVGQAAGYQRIFRELEAGLAELTGLAAVSLQPNSGAQGEFAGLLVIHAYHAVAGQSQRTVALIPQSAHGTNPASASMAGMQVVIVASDATGNIDVDDLRAKAAAHRDRLSCLMVTYPSTHGVFEGRIREVCAIVHEHGGQVYMDGANMNAQVGLTSPAAIGADVCHLNLHKTFAIPHGGGGPGMGPIAVAAHLAPFLPGHPLVKTGGEQAIAAVSAAPWGSASILLISYGYLRMLGARGRDRSDADRDAERELPQGAPRAALPGAVRGRPRPRRARADLRPASVQAAARASTKQDVAKRLMDYGFHAPTVSFPVPGTLMVEPTESEPIEELDRFCDAMIAIRQEIEAVATGKADRDRQRAEERAAHGGGRLGRRVAARLLTRAGGVSRGVAAAPQVLAAGLAHRQSLRRPQPHVRVPADRSVRPRGASSREVVGAGCSPPARRAPISRPLDRRVSAAGFGGGLSVRRAWCSRR